MTDINKQIEENKYWRTFIKENRCWTPTTETIGKLAYNNGYNKAKKELEHSSRWRKVSEELPENCPELINEKDSTITKRVIALIMGEAITTSRILMMDGEWKWGCTFEGYEEFEYWMPYPEYLK